MDKKSILDKIKTRIERVLPMTISSFILFVIVLYLLFSVGRSVWINYSSNKGIEKQKEKLEEMKADINYLANQIAYFKTETYREKQAREKLGYVAVGETAIALPPDEPEDKVADSTSREVKIKVPNYRLWWEYFFRG